MQQCLPHDLQWKRAWYEAVNFAKIYFWYQAALNQTPHLRKKANVYIAKYLTPESTDSVLVIQTSLGTTALFSWLNCVDVLLNCITKLLPKYFSDLLEALLFFGCIHISLQKKAAAHNTEIHFPSLSN